MPKPINPTIGRAPCPMPGCTCTADIRKTKPTGGNSAGRLYLHCPECGTDPRRGKKIQDWIVEKGEIFGAKGPTPAPEPEPETVAGVVVERIPPAGPDREPGPARAQIPEGASTKKRGGLLDWIEAGAGAWFS